MKRNGAEQPRETSSCGAGVEAGAGQERNAECGMRAVVRDALRDSLDPTEGWLEDSAMDWKT